MPDWVRSELACSVTFRESVRPSDREWVVRIVGSSGFFSEQETAVAAELVEEATRRGESSGYYFLFAERGREVSGYTCFGPIACTRSSFDLYWIAVLPEIRGLGLGRELLRRSETLIRAGGGTRIYVETPRDLFMSLRGSFMSTTDIGRKRCCRIFTPRMTIRSST